MQQQVELIWFERAHRRAPGDLVRAGDCLEKLCIVALVVAVVAPGHDRALAQREIAVGDHQLGVDDRLAAQALALWAGAVRRVEREQVGNGVLVVDIAVGAVQVTRIAPRVTDPAVIAEVSKGLGDAMEGIETSKLEEAELLQTRGW